MTEIEINGVKHPFKITMRIISDLDKEELTDIDRTLKLLYRGFEAGARIKGVDLKMSQDQVDDLDSKELEAVSLKAFPETEKK